MRRLIVVMGVSGCGKSTLGHQLADRMKTIFIEADDYHSDANIKKMSAGTPLDDADRADWIKSIVKKVDQIPDDEIVLACSALTPFVQKELLSVSNREIVWLYLEVDKRDLLHRLQTRDHFMPATLLESQYEALSVPANAVRLDGSLPLGELTDAVIAHLA